MNGEDKLIFLDTNILIYATIPQSPFHIIAVKAIEDFEQAATELWISRQVLREYLATLTRPQIFATSIPITELTGSIRRLSDRFRLADDNEQVTAHLLTLMEKIPIGGKQVHDANIVATMQAYGINRLLTHNVADFKRFSELITILPLLLEEV